jgi:hypothetical protein
MPLKDQESTYGYHVGVLVDQASLGWSWIYRALDEFLAALNLMLNAIFGSESGVVQNLWVKSWVGWNGFWSHKPLINIW